MISFFKDHNTYYKKINDNKIINITGISSSGKYTFAKKLVGKKKIEIIKLDSFFFQKKESKLVNKIYDKYPELIKKKKFIFKKNYQKKYSSLVYNDIVNEVINSNKSIVIVGTQIYKYVDTKSIKGSVYVLQPAIYKSILAKFKRIKQNKKLSKRIYDFLRWIKNAFIMTFINKGKIKKFINDIEKV